MILQELQSYTAIAKIEFCDVNGAEIECIIKQLTSTLDSLGLPNIKEFTAQVSPLIITQMKSGDPTHATIKASEAILNTWNIENFQALNIFAFSNRSHLLEIKKDEVLIWTGFMVPDQWSESFTATPYGTTMTFIDGLGLLQNEDFIDGGGCYWMERTQAYKLIGHLIAKIGLNRKFNDQINIIDETTTHATSTGTLDEKWVDLEAFRGMNCYQVLEELLKSYLSRIEYRNNEYYIRRWNDYSEDLRTYTYTRAGGIYARGTRTLENVKAEITNANTGIGWLENSQQLGIIPAWKSFELTQKYGPKESFLPRSIFTECDFDSSGDLKGWTTNGVEQAETDVRFKSYATVSPEYTPPAYLFRQTTDNYTFDGIDADNKDKIVFEFEFKNEGYQYKEQYTYVGPRGPNVNMEGLTSIDSYKIEVVSPEGGDTPATRWFGVSNVDDPPDNFEIGDRVIFRDTRNVPQGYQAGVIYTIVDVSSTMILVFRLSDTEPTTPSPFIPIQDANGTEFEQVSVYFSFIKTTVKFRQLGLSFSEQPNLSQDGELLTGAYLDFEVQKRDIDSNRSFILGNFYDNTNFGNGTGAWYVYIEKIRDTVPAARGNGSFLLKNVKCYIDALPEENKETVSCNTNGNLKESIDVMFGETPVKNVFRNNNLKFYNNFYSKSVTDAPGLQYFDVHPEPTFSMTPQRLIDIVKNSYRSMYNNRRFFLTGKLYSPNTMLFGKVLTETYTEKKYLMTSCNYDVFFCTFEGEWHEISQADATTDHMGSFDSSFDSSFD